MSKLMIHEVLKRTANAKTLAEKVNILRDNNTPGLREVLIYALNPAVKFFTDEVPKHTPDHAPEGLSFSSLYNEYRRFYIFLTPELERYKSGGKVTSLPRKKQLLIEMLEAIHPEEAKLFSSMIEGKFKEMTGLNKKIVDAAFPGLLV